MLLDAVGQAVLDDDGGKGDDGGSGDAAGAGLVEGERVWVLNDVGVGDALLLE